jgi:integrase
MQQRKHKPIEDRLYDKKGDGILWAYGSINGKAWNARTGFTAAHRDQAIAKARELERTRQLAAEGYVRPDSPEERKAQGVASRTTLKGACAELYKAAIRNGNKQSTLDFLAERCTRLIGTDEHPAFGAEFKIADFTRKHITDYVDMRLAESDSFAHRHTVQKEYRVLRQMLKICAEQGLWNGNLNELKIDAFKKSRSYYAPGERWLEEIEHIEAFVAQVSSGEGVCQRSARNTTGKAWTVKSTVRVDRKLHVLAYVNSGMRRGELFTIYKHHVSLRKKTAAVNYPKDQVPSDAERRKGKTISSKRVLGLNAVLLEVFERKMRDAKVGEPLFEPWPNARRDILAAWKRARAQLIADATEPGTKAARELATELDATLPHKLTHNDLRRTFCSQMAKAGVPLQTCADILGHEDIAMVRAVYRRVAPAELQAAMDMMPAMSLPPLKLQRPASARSAKRKAG